MTIDELNAASKQELYPQESVRRPAPAMPVYMAEGGRLGPAGIPGVGGTMGGGFNPGTKTAKEAIAELTPPGGFSSVSDLENAAIKVVKSEADRRGMDLSKDESKKWIAENISRITAENSHRVMPTKDYASLWKEVDGNMVNMASLHTGKPQIVRVAPGKLEAPTEKMREEAGAKKAAQRYAFETLGPEGIYTTGPAAGQVMPEFEDRYRQLTQEGLLKSGSPGALESARLALEQEKAKASMESNKAKMDRQKRIDSLVLSPAQKASLSKFQRKSELAERAYFKTLNDIQQMNIVAGKDKALELANSELSKAHQDEEDFVASLEKGKPDTGTNAPPPLTPADQIRADYRASKISKEEAKKRLASIGFTGK